MLNGKYFDSKVVSADFQQEILIIYAFNLFLFAFDLLDFDLSNYG